MSVTAVQPEVTAVQLEVTAVQLEVAWKPKAGASRRVAAALVLSEGLTSGPAP
jgi:hypothetical protein